MVALPGPRGGRRSSDEPRGPGYASIDRELPAFVRFIGGLDNGTALSSLAGRRGQVAPAPQPHHRPRAERVRRGALMVAQLRRRSDGQRVAADFRHSRSAGREIIPDAKLGRSRPARGLPRQNRCGGVVAPFRTIPAIAACRPRCRTNPAAATNRGDRRRARTQLRPRGDGRRRQNPIHQVAAPIVQRLAVQLAAHRRVAPRFYTISLRRD